MLCQRLTSPYLQLVITRAPADPLSTMNTAVCVLALAACLATVVQAQQFDRAPRLLLLDAAVHFSCSLHATLLKQITKGCDVTWRLCIS